jgi:Na+/H+-dicarboxylate symporter
MTLLNVNIQFRKEQVHSLEDIAKMGKIPYKIVVWFIMYTMIATRFDITVVAAIGTIN